HPLRLLFSRVAAFADDVSEEARSRESTVFDPTHPDGQCRVCLGVGGELDVDPELVVGHPERSLLDGASAYAGNMRTRKGSTMELASIPALAAHFDADLELAWERLPEAFKHAFLHGTDEQIDVEIPGGGRHDDWSLNRNAPLVGAIAELERLFRNAKTEKSRQKYRAFFRLTPCRECDGTGVGEAARTVTVNGWTYPRAAAAVVDDLRSWAGTILDGLNAIQTEVATPLLAEFNTRIDSLARLGLGHVSLSRPVPTLSGGELQRVRLSAQLGSGLTGIVYVLDEPSSGLHPNDRDDLVEVLIDLRDRGNTVIVVEHDMDVVRRCDWVVDIGPAAGFNGGELLASGPPADVAKHPASVTGTYIADTNGHHRTRRSRPATDGWLELDHLSRHNVIDASIRLPLGRYTCISGVSGSGKSTLLGAVADAVEAELSGSPTRTSITGADALKWIEQVTQAPIGRNARSNPATYTKLFDHIRRRFAATPAAQTADLDESAFSFNTNSGRCEACDGNGELTVDLHYLPSIITTCPTCHGKRFQDHILDITIDGLSIADVLELTIDQASQIETLDTETIAPMLAHLRRVGLGYLTLGQPAPALSGGEAQRLKLARLLARTTRSGNGLVVLDEPTAGLHPTDTERIIDVIDSLVERGTTVLVADHQTATRSEADWVITTGPGAGPAGGRIIDQAPPFT
ncbi:MAG: ATP-binding cassette domain-containing protein, partial [Acidimicrobiales bacterium]